MKLMTINFSEAVKSYFWNKNQKIYYWGAENLEPQKYLDLFETVSEFQSSILFILNNLITDGIEGYFDYYTLRKITFDYLLYGQFFIEVQKLRGGDVKLTHLDAEKCRFSGDLESVGYCSDWERFAKREYVFKPIVDNIKKDGIYVFKNPLNKSVYARPIWFSALEAIETAQNIALFHKNTSKNSFIPSKLIHFKNGNVSPEAQEEYERMIQQNYTSPTGKRFMMLFSEGDEMSVEITNLEEDKLDQKFEKLQSWIREQITISLSITSPALVGIIPKNQGFNSTEYNESYKIFMNTLIANLRKEIEYGLTMLFDMDITLGQKEEVATDITNNNTTQNDEGQNETIV